MTGRDSWIHWRHTVYTHSFRVVRVGGGVGGVHLGEIVVFLCVVAIALDVLSLDETLDALF